MRYRSSGDTPVLWGPHITTWDSRYPSNVVDLGPYYYRVQESAAYMVDDPRNGYITLSSGARRPLFKSVDHRKWSAEFCSNMVDFRTSTYNWQTNNGCQLLGSFNANPLTAANVAEEEIAWLIAHITPTWTDEYPTQFERMMPTMQTRANLSVFLYELRDLRRMFDLLPSKHLQLGKHKRRAKDWYSVLRYTNSQHLNYNFGWKPFLKDIKHVFTGMQSFEERFDKFMSRANSELTRHYVGQPFTLVGSQDIETLFYPFRVRRDWEYELTQCSTAQYAYSLSKYCQENARWLAYLDTLGLNIGPATIWAVIPWSFVVDWFVNVSGNLRPLEANWLEPTLDLHQACHSYHIDAKMRTTVYSSLSGSTEALRTNVSWYFRKVGLPNIDWSTKPLDADKIRLGSSLALSRVL